MMRANTTGHSDHLETGCDLILLSGGMSVDPDDVTRKGIRQPGADESLRRSGAARRDVSGGLYR